MIEVSTGLEVPLHRSLTEPILLAGAPRPLAIVSGTLAAAIGIGLQLWVLGAIFAVLGHALAVWGAKTDADFLAVFARHLKYPNALGV